MPNYKKQTGFIPLVILIVIGVAVLAGGSYVVRNEFLKTGKSGKAALDEKKITEQIKNPQELSEITPKPKGELIQNQVFTYKPQSSPSQASTSSNIKEEPGFTIIPPQGWEKLTPVSKNERAAFRSPETDKEEMEDNLVAKVQPMISIFIYPADGNLDDFVRAINDSSQEIYTKFQLAGNSKINFARQEARKVEAKFIEKSRIPMYATSYLITKNGFWVQIVGNSLESAWGKRVGELESSLKSFKFID